MVGVGCAYRRSLDDCAGLDNLLLVQLRTRTVKVADDCGHTGLVAHGGRQVDGLLGVILREAGNCSEQAVGRRWAAVPWEFTSSPYPGDGQRAFAARMPETRGGELRTSCGTWRVRCAMVSRCRSCRRSSFWLRGRRILLWAARAMRANHRRKGVVCGAKACHWSRTLPH